jgi:hypothetical protein
VQKAPYEAKSLELCSEMRGGSSALARLAAATVATPASHITAAVRLVTDRKEAFAI